LEIEFSDKNHVTKATVKTGDGMREIEPKVVIAADSVHSKVLNKLVFTNLKALI
jgi:2-polyprenyl-6-methoxyphenol hydroxylase-like FAD-dependent oxidoreductase